MTTLALSTGLVAALAVLVALNAFAVWFGLSFLRANKAAKAVDAGEAPAPAPVKVMSRRDFFRRSLITSLLVFGAEFGGGTIAFLWPNLKGGFGSKIAAGALDDIKGFIEANKQPFYVGAGRFYIVEWSGKAGEGEADYPTLGVTAEGIMPLYQRCVHLGCRVPFCGSSQWFECPCHGSKYNSAGEYQLGPAPRGMDRFHVEIDAAKNVVVDTSLIVLGPPHGTDTIHQRQEGAFCVATG